MVRAQRYGLANTKAVELRDAGLSIGVVDLVGSQDRRLFRHAHRVGHILVVRGGSLRGIDDEDDGVGLCDGYINLVANLLSDACGLGGLGGGHLKASRVDDQHPDA